MMNLELTETMKQSLAKSASDYIADWWMANSTEDERKAAAERKATPSGAYAFAESVARRHGAKCLPDAVTYEIVGIFMRNGSDGDTYKTSDDIAREEANAKARKDRLAKAKKANEDRKASLTPEQIAEEERIAEERKAKEAEADAKRKDAQALKDAKNAKIERAKAIAAEMQSRQLEFNF